MTARRSGYLAYGLVLLALVGWFIADFPILRVPLAVGFAVYGACLWRWPWLWLVAVPALLPLFDLASWSGRFFFDEFDAVVLLTVGVLALRENAPVPTTPLSRGTLIVLALLALSYAVSSLIRLWPPAPITVDSFANYASPYNSLRVAKGFVWALLLLQPLRQAIARTPNARLLLGYGFVLGLLGVAFVTLYERWLFTGVLAWVTSYRTTASFSSMHTGDGPIDVWLALAIPFLGLLLIHPRWLKLLPLTGGLILLALYCLIAAQSRSPVIAVALGYGVGLLALLATRSHRGRAAGALAIGLGGIVLVAVVALPMLEQTSIGQRFSESSEDAGVRLHHWRYDLSLRKHSFFTQLFGMGVGSFPAIHQERSILEPRATRYQYVAGPQGHFLTFWPDIDLYMQQIVPATQNSDYRFSVKVRTGEKPSSLVVLWCEVWMLTSASCTKNVFDTRPLPDQWQSWSTTIHTGPVGAGRHVAGLFFPRPTKLGFYVSSRNQRGIDVTDLSLKDGNGRELLVNGDFAEGADYWFWSEDNHWQWHTANLAVNILFDQGWFGLIAVGLLLGLTIARLLRQIGRNDSLSAVYLAAIIAFVVTGVTVSTFDQPRLALAFYLLCFAVLVRDASESRLRAAAT